MPNGQPVLITILRPVYCIFFISKNVPAACQTGCLYVLESVAVAADAAGAVALVVAVAFAFAVVTL